MGDEGESSPWKSTTGKASQKKTYQPAGFEPRRKTGLEEVNPRVREIQPPKGDMLLRRAEEIRAELQQGVKKPYKEVIDISQDDFHSAGMKPFSFVRQVIAACLHPELLHSGKLPADVCQRAQRLLKECDGDSVGSYSDSCGIPHVQRTVAEFITRRDGGLPSFPKDIFISSGSQRALMVVLRLLAQGEGMSQTGVLTPVPTCYTFPMVLTEVGAVMVPYQLCEEQGWALQVDELRRVLQASRGHCDPRVLYVINPGNPTGHVQSRKSIEDVIRLAAEERLFLLANEVYQDTVHGEGVEFVSYKRVLFEMGPQYSDTVQLASFNSISNGIGEGGLRAGYVELLNIDPAVALFAEMLLCTDICAPVTGQIALAIMADPPWPGDPSYGQYAEEVQASQETLIRNVRRVEEVLSALPGVSCQPAMGGVNVFPRLYLPAGAVEQAKEAGVEADQLYCKRLLEEVGLCVGPGCESGQREGIHHMRLHVKVPAEVMEEALGRLRTFHLRFMSEFS
ncbi:alanine aminotransferase 2-like [Megalops cyprinoides]|uniref:alanine aminotransferase 2-like n=1 Tax=Megalops cyprinoides TaxID=118141 RepID=UPI001864F4A8|nr:alanine aminotransferase 2-like [Megalops cyprinoides]